MASRSKDKPKQHALPLVGFAALVLFIAVGATQLLRDNGPFVSPQGMIFQAGINVGWAVGAKFSNADPGTLEFDEISNARRLARGEPFEYDRYVVKISQVRQLEYAPSGAPTDAKLLKVVAKVLRAP